MHRLSLRMAPASRRCPSVGARKGVIWMAAFAGMIVAGPPRSQNQAENFDGWVSRLMPFSVSSARAEAGNIGRHEIVSPAGDGGSPDTPAKQDEKTESIETDQEPSPSRARRLPFKSKANRLAGPTADDLRSQDAVSVTGRGTGDDQKTEERAEGGRDPTQVPSKHKGPDGSRQSDPQGTSTTVEKSADRRVKPKTRSFEQKTKQKKRRKRRGARRFRSVNPVNVLKPGVIVKNASKTTLRKAISKGFTVKEKIKMRGLGITLTRFFPPSGLDLSEAEHVLSKEVPGVQLGLNRKYRIYRAAMRSPVEKGTSNSKTSGGRACEKDHCIGREIIGWRTGLKRCAERLRIGIVDTAVDISHPAFAGKKITPRRRSPKNYNKEGTWHGTGVLSLLAGDQNSSTPGLIPNARFFVADAFYLDEDGQPTTDTLSLLSAFSWLKKKKVKLINMSLAGPPDDLLEVEIKKMSASGVIFVAAVGNEGPRADKSFPAGYDDVIAVTAVDKDLRAYRYANHGDHIDVAAPGVSVWTALPGAKSGYHSGTSFAAPFVTAAAAAIYRSLPKKSKSSVLDHLSVFDLGEEGNDTVYGRGLLLAPDSCSGGAIALGKKRKLRRGFTLQSDAGSGIFSSWLAR